MGKHAPAALAGVGFVAPSGYQLVNYNKQQWIMAADPAYRSLPMERWGERYFFDKAEPRGGLHRRFASLADHLDAPDAFSDAVKAFADRYGLLGAVGRELHWSKIDGYAEPLGAWADFCKLMADLIDLYDTANRGDLDEVNAAIAEYVPLARPIELRVHAHGASIVSGDADEPGLDLPYASMSRARRRAYVHIASHIGACIDGWGFDFIQERPLAFPTPMMHDDKIVFRILATCLAGYLLLEFACSLDESTELRLCETCGTEFIIDRVNGRRRGRFCSDRCRNRVHEARVREARRLRRSGMTLSEIAKRLNTRVSTVKRWTANTVRGPERTRGQHQEGSN